MGDVYANLLMLRNLTYLRVGVKHAQQPAKGDVIPDHDAEFDDLGVGKMLLEPDKELVVINRVIVNGQLLGKPEGALLARGKGRAVFIIFKLGDFFLRSVLCASPMRSEKPLSK